MPKKTPKLKKKKRITEVRQIAAINIGSTSIRLRIAEVDTKGKIKTIEDLIHPVPLSKDTFSKGYITSKTLRILCTVMKQFASRIKEYKIENLMAAATSAIREAENVDVVVDRIRHESGIQLTLIDQVEESRLNCQLILPFIAENLKSCRSNILYIDLGGGSTETLLIKNQRIVLANNKRLGTSRLFHSISETTGLERKIVTQSIIRNVVNDTKKHFDDYKIGEYIIANSHLNLLFKQQEGVKILEDGVEVPLEVLNKVTKEFAQQNDETIAAKLGISIADVELLTPAVLTTERLFKGNDVKRFFTADIELLKSVLNDLRTNLYGQNPLLEFGEQIVRSAKGLGERFSYDTKHAECVANLSLMLYDEMAEILDLTGKDRLYLEVAAILHDIGMFISDIAHHKHSQYLIEWSEIVGLNQDERKKIAMIARYHRKSQPSKRHADYMSMPAPARLKISKLSALLRLADALDRAHRQSITDLFIKENDTTIIITVKSTTEILVEQMAVHEKGDFLKDIIGKDIEVQLFKET